MSQSQLELLTKEEAEAARAFFAGPEPDRLQRFVGWMVKSGEFSGKVAEDIRSFIRAKEGRRA